MDQILVPRAVTPVPESWMKLLSNFAASWGRADGPAFGIHCMRCQQPVTAANGECDSVLRVTCGCQEYAADHFAILPVHGS